MLVGMHPGPGLLVLGTEEAALSGVMERVQVGASMGYPIHGTSYPYAIQHGPCWT